jgi:hypothetical protein
MRAFCISFLVVVVLVLTALNIHWVFFTHSITLELVGQSQTCFGSYVAVLEAANGLKIYDTNLTPLEDPKVTLTQEQTLLLTAYEPTCLKFPGISCIRKLIQVHETKCLRNVHKFVAKLDRDQYVYKVDSELELSVTVRLVKKSWFNFSDKVSQLTLQSGGILRNFPLKDNVNDPMLLKTSESTGASSKFLSVDSYTYVKGTLNLYGLVLVRSKTALRTIDAKSPALAAKFAQLPPICLRSKNRIGDEITIRSADRKTFSLTVVFMTLEGMVHEFYDDIHNHATSVTSEIENSQHNVVLKANERGSVWVGTVMDQAVSLDRKDCEEEQPTETPRNSNGSKLKSKVVNELKCISVPGAGVGLIVSDSEVLFRCAGAYRVVPNSDTLTSSSCSGWDYYPHDWQRLVPAFKSIASQCIVADLNRCTLGSNFDALCGSDKVPVFIKATGNGNLTVQLLHYQIFSIKESEMKAYTKLKPC